MLPAWLAALLIDACSPRMMARRAIGGLGRDPLQSLLLVRLDTGLQSAVQTLSETTLLGPATAERETRGWSCRSKLGLPTACSLDHIPTKIVGPPSRRLALLVDANGLPLSQVKRWLSSQGRLYLGA